jgi:hypothetical protein
MCHSTRLFPAHSVLDRQSQYSEWEAPLLNRLSWTRLDRFSVLQDCAGKPNNSGQARMSWLMQSVKCCDPTPLINQEKSLSNELIDFL